MLRVLVSLPWLLLLDIDGVKYRGTGTCIASVGDWVLAGDGVPFPILTLSGTTGVGGASGFAFGGLGSLFGCITGVGLSLGFIRALGALGAGRYGCSKCGVSGATPIGTSRIGAATCGVGDGVMSTGAAHCGALGMA